MTIEIDDIFGDPEISPGAFVSIEANITGHVIVDKNVIIVPGAMIRADECGPFRICCGTNIQDGVTIHGLLNKYVEVEGEEYSVYIGEHCSISHGALVHGPAFVGNKTFLGFNAIVHASNVGEHCFLDFRSTVKNAVVGNQCYLGINSIVKNCTIASYKYVRDGEIVDNQNKADLLPNVPKEKSREAKEFNKEVVELNKLLVKFYKSRKKGR